MMEGEHNILAQFKLETVGRILSLHPNRIASFSCSKIKMVLSDIHDAFYNQP